MDERDLFKRMDVINEETKRLGEENPTGPDETDPHVHKLIEEGVEIVKQLDPIMREKFRDDPAALAESDSIMHMCDDPDEDDPNHRGASQRPRRTPTGKAT